jgi:hypothetical protein
MLRLVLPALGLSLLVPATASAAPFGELPFQAVNGSATCLRATGTPGELVRSTRNGAEILQAGAAGLMPVANLPFVGETSSCPRAAARPGGAGVVAFFTSDPATGDSLVQGRLREPGGTWGQTTELLRTNQSANGTVPAVAVSERGDGLVASAGRSGSGVQILAARRTAGGAFGPTETLFSARPNPDSETRVRAGMSAGGEAVVAWSFQPDLGGPRELWATIATPGAAFHAPVRIGLPRASSPFDLAVGDGGHALIAFASGDDLLVAERASGADFGAATRVGDAKDLFAALPAAAVRADGGAVVAWQTTLGPMQAVIRQGPGPFGAPVTVAPPIPFPVPPIQLRLFQLLFSPEFGGEFSSGGALPDSDGANPRATILADGRALLTWAAPVSRDGVWWNAPRSATLPLSGGAAALREHGAELRDVGSLTPVRLADGTAGVAWADNGEISSDGRLHLAVEGAADAADPPAPSVRVLPPRGRLTGARDSLKLAVRCSAACDVRASVAGDAAASGTISLRRAGDAQLTIEPSARPIATLRGGPVRVLVRYGGPGARRAAAKSLTIELRRRPSPPRPRLLGAVARRDGDDVVVSFRTDRDAKAEDFLIYAAATRDPDATALQAGEPSGKKRRFRLRLRKVEAARFVTVLSFAEGNWGFGETTLRVKR